MKLKKKIKIAIDSPENGNDKHMLILPHALDITMAFTPVHNFLPQKSQTNLQIRQDCVQISSTNTKDAKKNEMGASG